MFSRVLARLAPVVILVAVVVGQPKALHSQGGPCSPYVSSGEDDPPMTGTLVSQGYSYSLDAWVGHYEVVPVFWTGVAPL